MKFVEHLLCSLHRSVFVQVVWQTAFCIRAEIVQTLCKIALKSLAVEIDSEVGVVGKRTVKLA